MIKFHKLKLFLSLSALFFFLFGNFVFAAEITLEAKIREIKVNQVFEVKVFINTDGESVNAIEGRIVFPPELLAAEKINDGGSIINFWIEKPRFESGQITFAGIIPGGYESRQGLIFSAVFLAKKEGRGLIRFSEARALRNDGQGTKVDIKISSLQFSVFKQILVPQPPQIEIIDIEPPETFMPEIARDPAIFEGKWFLVFATQDKNSGINHYEVREGNKPFVIAESPYLLQNQNLDEKIIVKAVDNSGNERKEILPPPRPRPWYKNYFIFAALIIIAAALAYLGRRILWRK